MNKQDRSKTVRMNKDKQIIAYLTIPFCAVELYNRSQSRQKILNQYGVTKRRSKRCAMGILIMQTGNM